MSKSIEDICMEFMEVEEGMMYGTVSFKFDNLMAAMKADHPAMIMDSLMVPVFIPALSGLTVDIEDAKKMYDDLTDFAGSFNVKELKKPLKDLKNYIIENAEDANFFSNDAEAIKLSDIRKKYVGHKIDLNKLEGDVWNRESRNGHITFHFYFSNYDDDRGSVGLFMDHVEMQCGEDDKVTYIEPLYCEKQVSSNFRGSVFSNTRATSMHYAEFDKVLRNAVD